MDAPPEPPVDDLSFEDALKELEQIVHRLETGEASLDDSIRLYERGDRLRQRCAERLDQAQAGRREYRAAAQTLPGTPPGRGTAELGGRSVQELAALCLRLSEDPG